MVHYPYKSLRKKSWLFGLILNRKRNFTEFMGRYWHTWPYCSLITYIVYGGAYYKKQ